MLRASLLFCLLLTSGLVQAADPKFEYGKVEYAKDKTVWAATVQAGGVINTGNSQTLALSAGGTVSMLDGKNKLQLDANGSYQDANAVVIAGNEATGLATKDDIDRVHSVTAEIWNAKLRYDRFVSTLDSLFIAGVGSGNVPAGIHFAGGGQLGYSRELFKNSLNLLRLEIGYDFTYQHNVHVVGVDADDLAIHSARAFAGYQLTFNSNVGLLLGLEALFNLNNLPGYDGPDDVVHPFNDIRLNGNAALTAKIWKNLAIQAAFVAKYTTDPAPLAAPAGFTWDPAQAIPRVDRLDTVTTISLVLTLI